VRVTKALRFRALGAAVVASGLLAWGCGRLQSPTRPDPTPDPRPVASTAPNPNPTPAPVLGGPAKPSPTPDPSATPNPSASPTPPPDTGAADCGTPLPPDLSRINLNVNQRGDNHWILDSTPIVGPDAVYCAKIGFTDGRTFCPVRVEGDPQRGACELYVTGRAKDTGRSGPTWSMDGNSCTGRPVCENSPDNQYQVIAYQGGTYRACGNKNDVCGEIVVDR
jgi:hypothetical protein